MEHVSSCTWPVIRSSLVYMPRRKTGILPSHSVMSLESYAASQNVLFSRGQRATENQAEIPGQILRSHSNKGALCSSTLCARPTGCELGTSQSLCLKVTFTGMGHRSATEALLFTHGPRLQSGHPCSLLCSSDPRTSIRVWPLGPRSQALEGLVHFPSTGRP